MKTIRIAFAALILAAVALNHIGCMTQGERISEPSGAAAVYKDGEWQPVDETDFRNVPNHPTGLSR